MKAAALWDSLVDPSRAAALDPSRAAALAKARLSGRQLCHDGQMPARPHEATPVERCCKTASLTSSGGLCASSASAHSRKPVGCVCVCAFGIGSARSISSAVLDGGLEHLSAQDARTPGSGTVRSNG